jgi:hypothetical protein
MRIRACIAALLLAAAARAQTLDEMSVARNFVRALAAPDHAELIALVDFERRSDERLAKGLAPHHWAELDEESRQLAIEFAVDDWTGSARGFNKSCVMVSVEALPDPDKGLGPVPDRRILRLVLRHVSTGEHRDLLLTLAPDERVIDLEQGPPYTPGDNPAGEAGLRPRRYLAAPTAGVRWPDNVEDAAREAGARFVEALLAAPPESVPAAIEALHRIGRTGVASTLERLAALDKAGSPDPEACRRLAATLEHITGRGTGAGAAPPTRSEVEDWLVWHSKQGWTFVPVPLEPDAPPREAAPPPPPLPMPDLPNRDIDPDMQPTPPTDTGRPIFAMPGRTSEFRQRLLPPAAALPLRFAGRKVKGRDVEADLPPSLREALNDWAEVAARLELSVLSTGRAEHLVLGSASDRLLDEVALAMDGAAALLEPHVPLVPPRETHAVVAFVFDEKGQRTPAWAGLLDEIVKRELAFEQDVAPLRRAAGALTRRQAPFFIQPTWDLTGEGEFRLPNEAAGKFAQCFVTSRAGELPPNVLWGLDAVVEVRLFKSVYNLNINRFIYSVEHFDWGPRTKKFLEDRQKSKGFSLAAQVADSRAAGQPDEAQMITWAVLDYLLEHPPQLRVLLEELAALQTAADPAHLQWTWQVPGLQTEGALARGLAELDPKKVVAWLGRY